MKPNSILHILNGTVMYHHFKQTNFLKQDEVMVPFNEAMCDGDTSEDLFTDHFVDIRSGVHQVTVASYKEITLKPLQPLFNQTFEHISLWFDHDMFCQINMLTILAWLDQTNHLAPIDIHLVDGQYKVLEKLTVTAKGYQAIYNDVLLQRKMTNQLLPATLEKGIERYLDYLKPDGELLTYIRANQQVSENVLIDNMLLMFKDYGLGDVQYRKLIHSSRKPHHEVKR